MNLANPAIQKATQKRHKIPTPNPWNKMAPTPNPGLTWILLEQGDTEISGAREVILTAIGCVKKASDEATDTRKETE